MKPVKRKQVKWRDAVNDKCKDCIYDPLAGGSWRQQVEDCTSKTCPLYTIRPVTEETRKNRAVLYQNEGK